LSKKCLMDHQWKTHEQEHGYPLVMTNIAMENPPIFNGKIHYNSPFSIAMLVYQRVINKRRCLWKHHESSIFHGVRTCSKSWIAIIPQDIVQID
jgi:hypothetical protein